MLLVDDYGWTPDRYRAWLADAVVRRVLSPREPHALPRRLD
ncbi:hypothetical protein [Pseudolysinimonas sp.]